MKTVLLVNIGGPTSKKEMRSFLYRMFLDPLILPLPKIFRFLLAVFISNTRYKKSFEKYSISNGISPIVESTKKVALELKKQLGDTYNIEYAFSYSEPYVFDKLKEIEESGVEEITVLPLYPHSAYCTTGSVKSSLIKYAKSGSKIKLNFVEGFYKNDFFCDWWVDMVNSTIEKNQEINNSPFLLFSAHAVPMAFVRQGDKYPSSIEKSAKMIADKMGLEYSVSYQSKMGKTEWTEPETVNVLDSLLSKNKNVLIIPISFICENLETFYDLDTVIIPKAARKHGLGKVHRVIINDIHSELIKSLVNSLQISNEKK